MTSIYSVVQSHVNKFKDTLYTSTVGEVVSLNYIGDYIESVNVRPSINRVYSDAMERQKPVINNVPVVFPSGGGGIISFPIQEGDTVLLVFGKEDITQFLRDKTPARPDTQRRFSYNDAIAIPCLTPFSDTLQPSRDNVEIKFKDSSIKIDKEGNIEIDSSKEVTINSATRASVSASESITVKSPTLVLDCPKVSVSGSLDVSGDISTEGDIATSEIPSLNTHKHSKVRVGTDKSGEPTT